MSVLFQINDYDSAGELIRGVYTASCLVYSVAGGSWEHTGNLSLPRWWHTAAVWRSTVLGRCRRVDNSTRLQCCCSVFGGRNGAEGTVIGSVERWDADTVSALTVRYYTTAVQGSWGHGPVGSTPEPAYGQCAAVLGTRVYLTGGLNHKAALTLTINA